MKSTSNLLTAALVATVWPAMAQDAPPAPNISGMAVQGMMFDLNNFRGDKNVLVVFYRMHN